MVVGIERYDAGTDWDLPGAADSALRIIGWLRRRGVPAANISVLLSPLEENRAKAEQALTDLGFPAGPAPATVEQVRRVVDEQLPERDGDFLLLFWSGHGALDEKLQRRLICADAGPNAKHNIGVTGLLAALSRKDYRGLRRQVVIIDACATFAQDMWLKFPMPESEFALGESRAVERDGLLATMEGESAVLDRKTGFGQVVAGWLDEHADALPPPMDRLASYVVQHFDRPRPDDFTAQHPVRIQEIRHGTTHVFGDLVPENVRRSARFAGLTTGQLRMTAATLARAPQLASEERRQAVMAALQGAIGPVPCSADQENDLLNLVSAVLDRRAAAALFQALLTAAATDDERVAAVAVRHRWELQSAVVPLLDPLRQIPLPQVLGAVTATTGDVPTHVTEFGQAVELLADLRESRPAESPLAEFVVRLQHRRPEMTVPAGWFSGQGLDEAAVTALRARVAAEARMPRKLVIDLRNAAPGAWPSAVRGYFSPCWHDKTVACAPTDDGMKTAVRTIVQWAKAQAADFSIGFLLPLAMLGKLPELEYEDAATLPVSLGKEFPVVLHAAERLAIEQLRAAWDEKLAVIEASPDGKPGVLFLDRDDAAEVRWAVQDSHDAYVAFSFVPQARPDPRGSAVMAAVAAGAPYVIWVEDVPASGYDLRARLATMAGPIKDFPAALRRHRRTDQYLSGALRVIWDNMDELPPSFERLGDRFGEELVSNG